MRYALAICAVLVPFSAAADDRDYLTALLEDSLSGAGRKVTVTGFEGALSSVASLQELTIADDQGVWLTLRDVTLDWSQSALLSGEVVVNELIAKDITLSRMPLSEPQVTTPEAGTFALPELPVSIDIDKISAEHISLGPTVLGQPIEAVLQASLQLSGGEGSAKLLLERTDAGPAGRLDLSAAYANADQRLTIDLQAEEAEGGIAAGKLGLPDAPSVALRIQGDGAVSDFAADVALTTAGVDRLTGQITLSAAGETATGFKVDLAGDLAPLFVPEYAAFFGDSVSLKAEGQRWQDGRLQLSQMQVAAKALQLDGKLALAADGLPVSFDLQGRIAHPMGQPVLLPLTTDLPVRVGSADLSLNYDATQGDGWTGNIAILGLVRDDFRASGLRLKGSGRIARLAGKRQVGGSFGFTAEGLEPKDQAVAEALGAVIWGDGLGFWTTDGAGLTISQFKLHGEDYVASGSAVIGGLDEALTVTGQARAKMEDLSRLSKLAGRGLAGAAELTVKGTGSPLTGGFDLQATALGQDMRGGGPQVDGLLKGQSVLMASVLRDTSGVVLRGLTLQAQSLKAQAEGRLATAGSDVTAELEFSDLRALGNGFRGGLTGKAHLTGALDDAHVTMEAVGRGLGIGQTQTDKVLAGLSAVSLDLVMQNGQLRVNRAEISNPQLTVKASGVVNGAAQKLDISARLGDLALLLPKFPGALAVTGTAVQDGSGLSLDLLAKGPGQIDATIKGTIATGFGSADLAIKGQALAALANGFVEPRTISGQTRFDLRLKGPLALASLSGPVTLSDGRIADPALKFGLQNISARANLAAGQAAIGASLEVSSGGKLAVQGKIGLEAPFDGDLNIDVQRVTLRDPDLYEARLNGQMTVKGPMAGGAMIVGRIGLDETELRVPSTGFGGGAGLPDLKHAREPAAVKATRARAGLLAKAIKAVAGGASFGLDIVMSAPSRLFVRGRGLDAELGGELRLSGTTLNVVPIGAFNLIRGRLDILGKRLEVSSALLQMEGRLIPFLHVTADTTNDGVTVGVEIEGPANDPVVSFTSDNGLPEEEVLAQLLFGQGLQDLSTFQAIQLANAVATLAGKGGVGVLAKLRKGAGLDNLDLKTDADGGASVTAGKYLTKNVYSEVTVDDKGKSQINLNLDVSKSIKLQAKTGSDGNTGLGVVLEKDY